MDSLGRTISYKKSNKHEMSYQDKELEKKIVNRFESLRLILQGECKISGNRE